MARADSQNIPSEYLELYKGALNTKPQGGSYYEVGKRLPFRIPSLQGCRTVRPFIQRGIKVTDPMCAWRHEFGSCVKCFNKQPETGGVTPPNLGPRGRDWWYTDPSNPGFWYFNWFMMQTLDAYAAGDVPDWCLIPALCGIYCLGIPPGNTYYNPVDLQCQNISGDIRWSYVISEDDDPRFLHVYWYNYNVPDPDYWPLTVKVYGLPDTFTCSSQPSGADPRNGVLLDSFDLEYASGFRYIRLSIGGWKRVALWLDTEDCYVGFRGWIAGQNITGPRFSL